MSEHRDIPEHLSHRRKALRDGALWRAARHVHSAVILRRIFHMFWVLAGVGLKLAVFIAILALVSVFARDVSVPARYLGQIEARVNEQIRLAGGAQRMSVARASFGLLGDDYQPTIVLDEVQFFDKGNLEMLRLPEVRSEFALASLLQGQPALRSLRIEGATLSLERDRNGRLLLNLGAFGGGSGAGDIAAVMAQIDAAIARPELAMLDFIQASDMVITLFDQRTEEELRVENGQFTLRNEPAAIRASLDVGLATTQGPPAFLTFTAEKGKGRSGARLSGEFSSLSARDLAGQVGVLNVLQLLDAPTSGHLTAEIDVDGQVSNLQGQLVIGKGALSPEGATPMPIESAHAMLSYEVATSRLSIEEIALDGPEGRFQGAGHVDLQDFEAMVPQSLLGQFRLTDLYLAPTDVFEGPVSFETGIIDLRYRPLARSVEIGQLVLRQGETKIDARGQVGVDAQGWRAAIDAQIAEISAQDLLALWPQEAKSRTRDWLHRNILEGDLSNVSASLRLAQSEKSRQGVTFDFNESTVRYMRAMPPIQKGVGYGAINGNQFILNLYSGSVMSGNGHEMDVSGSVLEIADMSVKPTSLVVDLNVKGDMRGAMSLLDEKPLGFISKAGLSAEDVTGRADLQAKLNVPLVRGLQTRDVGYEVRGILRDVRSEVLVKGRVLEADRLDVEVGSGKISIGGAGRLAGVDVDATWSRKLGKDVPADAKVEGWVALSPRGLDTFGVRLPSGMMRGAGRGQVSVILPKGAPPQMTLTSDLKGIGLQIPTLGWSKPSKTAGRLETVITLGASPDIEVLKIKAADLTTDVRIDLKPGAGFERAVFRPLRIGNRFNSEVQIISRGAGQSAQIVVNGGQLDIRRFAFGSGGSGNGGGAGAPVRLALDQLILSDGIALKEFTADLRNNNGLSGVFKANVNGAAAISGRLVPTARGAAIEVIAKDGGAVMRGSGIFRNARGGAMQLRLQPTGRPGEFDGKIVMKNTRVVNAPSLASLLSALSVIGLLEQLDGSGIPFSDVEADFVLGKSGVTVKSSSAVGASMGITMEGVYNTSARKLDMQGVISPIYAVNGLFGALFAPRKGEGLFGFTYSLKGAADNPQVGVNPLSMLTPGIFREIFRQSPPQL